MVASLRNSRQSVAGNLVVLAGFIAVGYLYASVGKSARGSLLTDLLLNVILVVGLQIFIGNTGVLSFGHMGFALFAGYGTALLAIPVVTKLKVIPKAPWDLAHTHLSPVLAASVGIAIAVALAALVGLVVARTPGLAATMITLAFLFVVIDLTKNWKDLTNGGSPLSGIPKFDGRVPVIVGAILSVMFGSWFRFTRPGRFAQASREDELAAGAMGIDIARPRYVAFVASVAVIALGVTLRAQVLGTVSTSQFNFEFTILILAMLVVGGMRTVTGAIIGTALVTFGKEFFRFIGDGPHWLGFKWSVVRDLPDIFLGVSLLAVLLFRNDGLLGDWDAARLFSRFRNHESGDDAPSPAGSPSIADGTLEIVGLGVTFGGFVAVDAVSMSVAPGAVHGVIGPNGAGKTTLVNLLTGLVPSSRGSVSLGGAVIDGPPHMRARAGLARTFQNLRVFASLSVRENIEIAQLVSRQHRGDMPHVATDELLAIVGLTDLAQRTASTLDYGNQRRLEIARAAALRPKFLLLDEPTSGMGDDESAAMVSVVRRVASAIGAAVVVIDHDLGFITKICDRITVLDQGAVLAEGTPAEIRSNPAVIAAYLGTQANV